MNGDIAREHIRRRLRDEFDGVLDAETVDRFVDQAFIDLTYHAEVQTWVPVMAERYARQTLLALAKAEGHRDQLPVVLFVDSEDAGRSQLARALFEGRAEGRAHSWSGGFEPAFRLRPEVVQPLLDLGVDPVHEFPKPLTDGILTAADVIVALGDLPGALPHEKRILVWEVAPVAGLDAEQVAEVVGHLDELTRDLVGTLFDSN